jgi:hypothetical protein
MLSKTFFCFSLVVFAFLPISSANLLQDKRVSQNATPVLWQEPKDLLSRDLYLGAGGEAMKPELSKVTFVKEETGGYSTKYRVKDGAGKEWVVKLGKEAQSDTVASRLLWAVGYTTEISYLVPSLTIEGKGTFENARFEARPEDVKRVSEWKWSDNPFKGTKEFQGLKVMMLLLNNWDIKDANNKILLVRNSQTGEAEHHYIISDLGATFGKTGGVIGRSRNKPEDFAKAKFVKVVKQHQVFFVYDGKRSEVFSDITVEQAKWIGSWLSQLSEQQIKDALRAGNYSPEQIEALTQVLRDRINTLASLSEGQAASRQ